MLSWDAAGRLAAWQNAPTSPTTTDTFLSDGSGERLEQQVTSGGTTTTTRYIGALAQYIVAGTTSWQKYYSFAGRLVAGDNGHWHELLQDQLGTTQVQLNASGAGESGSLRNPYGSTRYGSSAFLGDLGYTGQRKDSTPNLTYFGARYYDQDVGVFLAADTWLVGLNRYAYVSGNPETVTDPSGHGQYLFEDHGGDWNAVADQYLGDSREGNSWGISWGAVKGVLQFFLGAVSLYHDARTLVDPHASMGSKLAAVGDAYHQVKTDLELPFGIGLVDRAGALLAASSNGSSSGGGANQCSFRADTPVATPSGERPIASLRVGDTVTAYNPATGQAEAEPVQHVWVNHDRDLVDVRVATSTSAQATAPGTAATTAAPGHPQASGHGLAMGESTNGAIHLSGNQQAASTAAAAGETIHTTANHPWLTVDRGWVAAGQLTPGERVVTLNGGTGSVVWVRVMPGAADRYNLTVAHDHTYAVGAGQWVVHNTGCLPTRDPKNLGFTQQSISPSHRDGHTVAGNIQWLRDNPSGDLPAIRIFQKSAASDGLQMTWRDYTRYGDNLMNGEWYTLDNRRLYEYVKAPRNSIPVIEVPESAAMEEMYKWSTTSWGIDLPILLP